MTTSRDARFLAQVNRQRGREDENAKEGDHGMSFLAGGTADGGE